MANGGIYYWRPLLPQLDRLGIEMDQRLQQAWNQCASSAVTTVQLLTALRGLGTRGLECLPGNWLEVRHALRDERHPSSLDALPVWNRFDPQMAEIAAPFNVPFWMRAIEFATRDTEPGGRKTIACHHFLRAISETLLNPWEGEVANTPPLLDFLGACHGERCDETMFLGDSIPRALQKMPRTRLVLEALGRAPARPDDFQYVLGLEGGRPVFRAVSVMDDFAIRGPGGTVLGGRGLLTHFKEAFGAFTPDEIGELEQMLANPKAAESDFQAFFEAHPHFFRRWDYREVYSQVFLTREEEGPLIPDFILTNPEAQQAAIVELKLPKPILVRHQPNRERFTDAVMTARAQLLRYGHWFDEKENRRKLSDKLGLEIYRPRLAVIIGRSSDFECGLQRQRLSAENPDMELVTYDDIVDYAKRRVMAIRGR